MADEKQLEILQDKANFRSFKPKPFNMREFYDRAGHDIRDMLLSCHFRGEACSAEDFKVVSESLVYGLSPWSLEGEEETRSTFYVCCSGRGGLVLWGLLLADGDFLRHVVPLYCMKTRDSALHPWWQGRKAGYILHKPPMQTLAYTWARFTPPSLRSGSQRSGSAAVGMLQFLLPNSRPVNCHLGAWKK